MRMIPLSVDTESRALRVRVATMVGQAWPQFVQAHPALSRVIDPELLKDYTFDTLADDPAFVEAYRNAVEARVAVEAVTRLIEPFVRAAIGRLA